jgi:ATP-binding protein involved in chromosome partitioning
MTPNQEQILAALKHVKHPGMEQNIVDAGMVSDVRAEGSQVFFSLTFPKTNDPLSSAVVKACTKALKVYVHPDAEAHVTLKVHRAAEPPVATELQARHTIAVASGKGGVGKSTVAVNLAVALAGAGYRVGLLDADVYGPSVPKMFRAEDAVPVAISRDGKDWIQPVEKYGVKMLSIGFFVKPEQAVVWRGPMATSALKQLVNQGDWGELDFLLIDMPPGTGDVHITIAQELKLTGAVIVSTPQEVALSDVIKGIAMFRAEHVEVEVLGLIENMSWFTPAELPDHRYFIFGKEGCKRLADEMELPLLGQIPLVQSICEGGDIGVPPALDLESVTGAAFRQLAGRLVDVLNKQA